MKDITKKEKEFIIFMYEYFYYDYKEVFKQRKDKDLKNMRIAWYKEKLKLFQEIIKKIIDKKIEFKEL